ncbi:hypothetical protein FHG87_018836 [Trinorchestia longiramus]|nr:hypothetical protein FHG87_018836 [Trinorchestia longiramus]
MHQIAGFIPNKISSRHWSENLISASSNCAGGHTHSISCSFCFLLGLHSNVDCFAAVVTMRVAVLEITYLV